MTQEQQLNSTAAVHNVRLIPFCAPFPSISRSESPPDELFGVVGTITLRGQSAVIWFGWGEIVSSDADDGQHSVLRETRVDGAVAIGGGNPPMGSMSLSMPPTSSSIKYGIPSTQLVGASSEEDMMIGQQISSRLAKRVGWPIFVSCSLHGWADDAGGGARVSDVYSSGFDDVSPQQAVALAEKEVIRILLSEKQRILSQHL